ncbi:MAG: MBL fold metallo-hydrolase [Candidatus Aenigmarchaeota archaeon]|nr:MBL fold metallo-hydrolase [Candidatus Aenigmarchaeota archaeon]
MDIGNLNIEWVGHSTFKIKYKNTVIYFDPYILDKDPEKADLILITHEHFDHCDNEKVHMINKSDTIIVTNVSSAKKLSGNVKMIEEGKEIIEKSIKVRAVNAYNVGKPFHPKGFGIGFIIDVDGTRIYHAGDTDLIQEMANYKTDVALLPIGGTYTMNEEEAANAAILIQPKIAIPMHFNFIKGTKANPEIFERNIQDQSLIEAKTLKPIVRP